MIAPPPPHSPNDLRRYGFREYPFLPFLIPPEGYEKISIKNKYLYGCAKRKPNRLSIHIISDRIKDLRGFNHILNINLRRRSESEAITSITSTIRARKAAPQHQEMMQNMIGRSNSSGLTRFK
jgi:hypothetical protein